MAEANLHLTVLGLSLVALLLLSAVQEAASDNDISYGGLNADHVPGDPSLHRPDAAANKYNRGCETEEQCRGGNP